jgi:hypothetical protein
VQGYQIEIPNAKVKTYSVFIFFMLCLNFIGFGLVFLKASGSAQYLAIAGMLINCVCWLFYLINKKHIKKPITEIAIAASATLWFYLGNTWFSIGLLLFAAMAWVINKKQIVSFTKEGIVYPSFPTKKYTWAEVNQVILKDNVLTLDFKNNQFLQFTLDSKIAANIQEQSFNKFCNEQHTQGGG